MLSCRRRPASTHFMHLDSGMRRNDGVGLAQSFLKTALAVICLCLSAAADATAADQAALEARFKALTSELRCLVCQNQTIADSNAALAIDLRNEVQRLLHEGATDAAVIDYMVARYGDFVLYRPPVKATTWLLWAAPAAFLVAGVIGWVAVMRGGRRASAPTLSDEERRRAAALLAERACVLVEERQA